MALTHDTTHAAEARDLLCQQFKGNTALEALLNANSVSAQSVEDALWTLQTMRLPISVAVGSQLDGLGDIVGQPRNGMDDAHYLLWLQARLLANSSVGAPETLISIAHVITEGANEIHLVGLYPASVVLWIGGLLDAGIDPDSLAAILAEAVAAGVNLQIQYSLVADANAFTFSSGDTEEASTAQGWQDTAAEVLVNGSFANWTGDDPNDWEVIESLPNSEVSRVGSGESHGGAGTGACNLYNDGLGDPFLLLQPLPSLTIGATYAVEIVISAITGTLHVFNADGSEFDQSYSTVGTKTFTFVAGVSTRFAIESYTAVDATIDSISVTNDVTSGGLWVDVEEAF